MSILYEKTKNQNKKDPPRKLEIIQVYDYE